jgi:hypothetical protein
MYYHANIENQIKEILESVNLLKHEEHNSENKLVDFIDGTLYKKLIQSEDGILFKKNEAISLNLNTDGISTFNKSKNTIWPFYLIINEICIEERFLVENMVLADKFKFYILSN